MTPNNLSIPWISTTIRFAKKCWGQGEEDEKEETVFIIPSVVIKSIDFDTLVFIGTPLESNSFPLNVFDYQSLQQHRMEIEFHLESALCLYCSSSHLMPFNIKRETKEKSMHWMRTGEWMDILPNWIMLHELNTLEILRFLGSPLELNSFPLNVFDYQSFQRHCMGIEFHLESALYLYYS